MRDGFSLIEVAVALAVMALVGVIAIPNVRGWLDTYATISEARSIAGAHDRARILATVRHRAALLQVTPDSLRIGLIAGPDTLFIWRTDGPAARGVSLTPSFREISFSPLGITWGFSNATFTLTRGNARHRVIVSRLGRVRLAP